MDKILQEMIDKGLVIVTGKSILDTQRQYLALVELQHTQVQTEPDMFASWLRLYRMN